MKKQPTNVAPVPPGPNQRVRFHGPVVKPKDRKGTLYRLWQYIRKEKKVLFFSIICITLASLLSLVGPYFIGVIIDDYMIPRNVHGTIIMVLLLLGVYIFQALFTWLQQYLMVLLSTNTMKRLRQDVFQHLQTLSLKFFDNRPHGDTMSRVTNDIDQLYQAISQSVSQIINTFITVTGILIAMFYLNWMMALVTLCILPLMLFATKKVIHFSRKYFTKRQKDLGELNGVIEECISGLEVIQLFGKEEHVYRKFSTINERLRDSSQKAEIASGVLGPVNNFINNLGVGLIVAAGALLTLKGLATIGVIASFVTYSRQFFRPINQLSSLLNMFQGAIAGAERTFEILDELPEIVNKETTVKVDKLKGKVEFHHVYFSYNGEKDVLKDIHFSVQPGQKVAIVGPTGSGKTTIINLLMRFYDCQSGEIKIDGKNIQDYSLQTLRENIGIVLQEPYLFSDTIMENIRYGRLDATDEEVIEAAKIASAHHFIMQLPDGYHTVITQGGENLSQGQKQLLSIARAVLESPNILILDEATASVDTRTELEIQKGLLRLMEGRTSFVIAHRLKTIEDADQIIVIHNGEMIEQGSHKELLAKRGFYYQSYENQFIFN